MEPNKNLWKYFPDSKGIINGFANTFLGMGGLVFNLLSDKLVNPAGIPAENIGEEKFYPPEVAANVFI